MCLERYLLTCALGVAILGAVGDVRSQRIPNWVTYGGLLGALFARVIVSGWPGLKDGLIGLFGGGALFFFFFFLGGIGGGDVKLMAATGAWAGREQIGNGLVGGCRGGWG